MDNQIILYNNQSVGCLIYSSQPFTNEEKSHFDENKKLDWDNYSNPKIICNFGNGLTSSVLAGITDNVTGYEISKKRPEENFSTKIGYFPVEELKTDEEDIGAYYIIDYNVKNNNEYSYFVSPMTDKYVQTTLEEKIFVDWDIFSLTPIYQVSENKYTVVKDEFGKPVNWAFHLNYSEGDITLNQDKTSFTTFSSKPKVIVGDLNYYSGKFSCLLGNILYGNEYYEPNILLEKWDKMIKENHIYLFKNIKGNAFIVYLEDGTKKKYQNDIINSYILDYNGNKVRTICPTTIDFSFTEILDADTIQVYGD